MKKLRVVEKKHNYDAFLVRSNGETRGTKYRAIFNTYPHKIVIFSLVVKTMQTTLFCPKLKANVLSNQVKFISTTKVFKVL